MHTGIGKQYSSSQPIRHINGSAAKGKRHSPAFKAKSKIFNTSNLSSSSSKSQYPLLSSHHGRPTLSSTSQPISEALSSDEMNLCEAPISPNPQNESLDPSSIPSSSPNSPPSTSPPILLINSATTPSSHLHTAPNSVSSSLTSESLPHISDPGLMEVPCEPPDQHSSTDIHCGEASFGNGNSTPHAQQADLCLSSSSTKLLSSHHRYPNLSLKIRKTRGEYFKVKRPSSLLYTGGRDKGVEDIYGLLLSSPDLSGDIHLCNPASCAPELCHARESDSAPNE